MGLSNSLSRHVAMSTTVSFSNESSKQVTLTYEKLGCSKFAAFVEAVVWISPPQRKA